ncbi:MAG: aminoacyl-histidine dipeptidase [Bacteroidota bacterium]
MTVRDLAPKSLWNHFADLNAVPRASKKEAQVIRFMMDFANEHRLEVEKDHVGNVLIRKPGSKGYEDKPVVVMQSHLDMVHQKNADVDFDFATQGIDMYVEGDWVKARGTTLGADNGIGVATIMSLLASKDIDHPPLEALFTIDEETGMTGALELKGGWLTGKTLLNLDTEDDRELTIGCAGGVDLTASRSSSGEPVPEGMTTFQLSVSGLSGGHSGMDIHKGLANANKLMNRLLWKGNEEFGLRLASIKGGGLRNAIPRESFAVVCVPEEQAAHWKQSIAQKEAIIRKEYSSTDPEMVISVEPVKPVEFVILEMMQHQVTNALYAAHNGIYRMSPDIANLVQTSNNIAKVSVDTESCEILCLTRSSVDSEKFDLANALTAAFATAGFSVEQGGLYPGWTPTPKSDLVEMMSNLYREMYQEEPHVNAIHAGLECGILSTNYPDFDMISFGPNIRGAHSPDERCQITSVQKYWGYLLEVLKRL